MLRTHKCGELRKTHAGQTVTLAGWVHRVREHGGVTFIDLRDRYGLVQIVADEKLSQAIKNIKSEFVVQIVGLVCERPVGSQNPNIATGDIEIHAHEIRVLNPAKSTPFMIDDAGKSISPRACVIATWICAGRGCSAT